MVYLISLISLNHNQTDFCNQKLSDLTTFIFLRTGRTTVQACRAPRSSLGLNLGPGRGAPGALLPGGHVPVRAGAAAAAPPVGRGRYPLARALHPPPPRGAWHFGAPPGAFVNQEVRCLRLGSPLDPKYHRCPFMRSKGHDWKKFLRGRLEEDSPFAHSGLSVKSSF